MRTLECPSCDEFLDDAINICLDNDDYECPYCKAQLVLRYFYDPENESFDYFELKD